MAKATTQRKTRTTIAKEQEPILEQAVEPEEVPVDPPIDGADVAKIALGPAYRTYLEGRKGLAQAFKEREYRDQEAYRDAERRYRLCQEAIEKAVKMREKAELDAADAHRLEVDKAIEKASQSYKDKTRMALAECKQRVMDAWKNSTETPEQMTSVCEEAIDKAMKAREKAELDALDVYRQDVDKSVDKASQAYKDKMKQALAECKLRVIDAWKSSMETSARMTGVFEEEKPTSAVDAPSEGSQEYGSPRLKEKMLVWKNSFVSAIEKAVKA